MADDKIEILTREGKPWRVDREKYEHVRERLMAILPAEGPGLTFAEVKTAILPKLSPDLFPGGDKIGWWLKSVQLDHEARGLIERVEGRPLRFRRA